MKELYIIKTRSFGDDIYVFANSYDEAVDKATNEYLESPARKEILDRDGSINYSNLQSESELEIRSIEKVKAKIIY